MTADLPLDASISQIWRFPVKSMQGEEVSSAELVPSGIDGDRLLAVRDLTTGKILSAKAPKLGRALLSCAARRSDDGTQVLVTVGDTTYGHLDDAAALDVALSTLLGRPAALVGAGADGEVYASEWPELDDMVLSGVEMDLPMPTGNFADVDPLHLITTASLAHLSTLAPDSVVTVGRFRPGIVIDVPIVDSFVENDWPGTAVRLGGAAITFGPASPRCIMTTLAQPGLEADPRVLRALATHNKRDYAGFGNFACLGIYATVSVSGTVSVGDRLTPI